jgi:alpha-glucosidase
MIGTRSHMLAMYVVLESYLVSLCDYPQAYEGQPGFEFLTRVPTTWDETRVPAAQVGAFVTMARRKGSAWYLGSITNSEPRTIEISLDFLEDGEYTATIYRDGSDSDSYPNHIVTENRTVRKNDVIPLKMAAGGDRSCG